MATLGANPEFYAPFDENARGGIGGTPRRRCSSITCSSTRRSIATSQCTRSRTCTCMWCSETDAGAIVSGAKMLATGSALTHATFVAQNSSVTLEAGKAEDYALVFIAPLDTPGAEAPVPRVVRAERAQPVRPSAFEPLRRKRRRARVRPSVHPVGELSRLSRRRARERVLPRVGILQPLQPAIGDAARREARLHDRTPGARARDERHERVPRRASRARRGRRLAHAALDDDDGDGGGAAAGARRLGDPARRLRRDAACVLARLRGRP